MHPAVSQDTPCQIDSVRGGRCERIRGSREVSAISSFLFITLALIGPFCNFPTQHKNQSHVEA